MAIASSPAAELDAIIPPLNPTPVVAMPTSPYHDEDSSRGDCSDSTVAIPQQPNADSYAETDGYGDSDSAYSGDSLLGDDTKTLSTYITEYRYEFGRRYHSYHDGAYWV